MECNIYYFKLHLQLLNLWSILGSHIIYLPAVCMPPKDTCKSTTTNFLLTNYLICYAMLKLFYQARESSLVPLCLLTVNFLQKT